MTQQNTSGELLGLRDMLFGFPLSSSTKIESMHSQINMHLYGLIELIPIVYGNTTACKQAVLEIKKLIQSDNIEGKRAVMLYSILHETEIRNYWNNNPDKDSTSLSNDLCNRVLPFLTPRFIKHNCQCPDSFVVFSMLLTEMWKEESLGN